MTRVTHPLHGPGQITALRRGGRIAVVRFDRHPLPLDIPVRELTQDPNAPEPATPQPSTSTASTTPLAPSFEQELAMLTLEAMRLGVVPSAELSAYTVGRDTEIAIVNEDLETARTEGGAVRAFLADYGVGKTHLLELIQSTALAQNFLTARVTLDPEECSPAHPKRVYRSLVRALRYPDRPFEEGAGLRPLLTRAIASPEALARFRVEPRIDRKLSQNKQLDAGLHLYLTPALAYFRELLQPATAAHLRGVPPEEAEAHLELGAYLLLDWLEGHPTLSNGLIDHHLSRIPGWHPRVYSLLDYRPWARIYGYLLSGLSTLARAAGYAGLVLLLDEAEFYALLSSDNREHASFLFKAWTAAALGDHPELPFAMHTLGRGGAGIQKDLPPRFGDAPGLYLVFAMTPNEEGRAALESACPPELITAMSPLSREDYLTLARRVCDFYVSARPDFSVPAAIIGPLGKVLSGLIDAGLVENPRHAMKFIIEFLDVVRYHPSSVPQVVANLQQDLLW